MLYILYVPRDLFIKIIYSYKEKNYYEGRRVWMAWREWINLEVVCPERRGLLFLPTLGYRRSLID